MSVLLIAVITGSYDSLPTVIECCMLTTDAAVKRWSRHDSRRR